MKLDGNMGESRQNMSPQDEADLSLLEVTASLHHESTLSTSNRLASRKGL